jgi:hypothetical protein
MQEVCSVLRTFHRFENLDDMMMRVIENVSGNFEIIHGYSQVPCFTSCLTRK